MIRRLRGLDLRRSLRTVMGAAGEDRVEVAAARQERTIDALLERLYRSDDERRREMVLLADEVGLGKTFVALGVACSVLHQREKERLPSGPVLVVTPTSHALFKKWHREADRFRELIAPPEFSFDIECVETPHHLAHSLRVRRPTLVIARMSAVSGRLHNLDVARMAVLHALLQLDGLELTMTRRLELLHDWPAWGTRENLDLRRSGRHWDTAREHPVLGFDDSHVRGAWARLDRIDPALTHRVRESFRRVRGGQPRRASFWEDVREICRASLCQAIPHGLPIVVVDEIHNWKNHPQSWRRFLHMFGGRIGRLLGLSATPFQLGPHELLQVLDLRKCLNLSPVRREFLSRKVEELGAALQDSTLRGGHLRETWSEILEDDQSEVSAAWRRVRLGEAPREGLPPRIDRAVRAASKVMEANGSATACLSPFLVRHRREVAHRAWWVGRDAAHEAARPTARGASLRWRPGLDVHGDAELVHYLMMRAVQEEKDGRGATSLGADLGGSYSFFRKRELPRWLPGGTPEGRRYLGLVQLALSADGHEHPKVAVTAERAFRAWLLGEKTLVFCFNVATTAAIQNAVQQRVAQWQSHELMRAFECDVEDLERRLTNFQNRLYNYRQSLFLLFQDHPLAGPGGRLPNELALRPDDLDAIAHRLAAFGEPRDRGSFDRRLVLATAEQVLVARWKMTTTGCAWLSEIAEQWLPDGDVAASVLARGWRGDRRRLVEGLSRSHEPEPLPGEEDEPGPTGGAGEGAFHAWREILDGKPGRSVIAPYLQDASTAVPSLLATYHSAALHRLPMRLRRIAVRMLRRFLRSPGFLARFLLPQADGRPDTGADDDGADADWTTLVHRKYATRPQSTESAHERFSAYLESLEKAKGLQEQIAAYEEATRNRDVIARVTGNTNGRDRDRMFNGFNSPLVPEVLIVTSVGQEGIDLHRECRHVIHHDLPWNPATLEQRTGRVDRIGSKTERVALASGADTSLDVVVPYIAGTYDEYRFRVVHGRAHIFDVTMGGDYAVDGHRHVDSDDSMEIEQLDDDEGTGGVAWVPLPREMAEDLRLRLGTQPPRG